MNRRIRKKKHVREFDFKGFEVTCKFQPPLDEVGVDSFIDSFIEYVEQVGLGCGGGINSVTMGQYISRYTPGRRKRNGKLHYKSEHCTELDRTRIGQWLTQHGAKEVNVGPLTPSSKG